LLQGSKTVSLLGGDVQIDVELAFPQAQRAPHGLHADDVAESRIDDLAALHEDDHVVLGSCRGDDGHRGRLPADVVELHEGR